MKYLLSILFSTLLLNVYAQDYGIVLAQEIDLKECSFDKAADAVILLDKAVSFPDDQRYLYTKRRIKLKVLKPSGISRGDVRISFYSKDDYEYIKDLEAYVYNVEETGNHRKTVVDKKSIFTQKLNELYSEIKIAMPEVKVGTIIEYQYTSVKKNVYGIRDWYFQDDIPTLLSHYDLTIQPGVAFAYKVVKSPALNIDIKTIKDEGRVLFEMKNIGGLREEPFMDAPRDYLQRVVFQLAEYQTAYGTKQKYANSWQELAKELLNDNEFGKAIEKNVKGSAEFIAGVQKLPTDFEKMVTIHNYVRKTFNWNRIYSIYISDGLSKVWDKKIGSAGELNLLLVNLLKEAKLEAYPLLVSDRDHGKVDASYPFIGQFSHVAAFVMIDGARYILDALDSQTPVDIVPFDLLNTNAFLVSKKASTVILLKDDNRMNKNYFGVDAVINEDGSIKGEVSAQSFDYSRLNRVADFKRKTSNNQFISKYFQREVTNIHIDSLDVKNVDADSLPLEQKFKFNTAAMQSGDYWMVSLNMFGAIDKSPFVADNRFTNINFGCQTNQSVSQVIRLPKGMKPDVLPKSINLVMPDNSITLSRVISYDASTHSVTSRLKWQISRTLFVAEEYPTVKEFYKKMVDILNEPLVLKKS